ncbi:MAG: Yip1 family protein [Granulosicoccaceae bacterium]
MLKYLKGLFQSPGDTWQNVHDQSLSIKEVYVPYLVLLAAIPAVCIFLGGSQVGWTIGDGDATRLTVGSAAFVGIATYFALLVGIFLLGYSIHWMSKTYGVEPSLDKCVAFAALVISPMMLAGVIAVYPSLWIYMLVFLVALAYSVYLLYGGLPIVLGITQEQGFVYSSAILTVGLVMFVALLGTTVVVWSNGLGPVYVR